eukprot:jgi/Mesvir1/15098/Mv14738-RA.1
MVAVAAKKRPASAPAKTLKATRAKSATKPTKKRATSHRVRATGDMVVVDKGKRPADERAIEESRAAKVPRTGEHGMAPTSSSAGAGPSSAPPAEFARGAPPRPEEFARPAASRAGASGVGGQVLPEVRKLVEDYASLRDKSLTNFKDLWMRTDFVSIYQNVVNARNRMADKLNTIPLDRASFDALNAAIDEAGELAKFVTRTMKQKRLIAPQKITWTARTREMPPPDPVASATRPDPPPASKPKEPKGGHIKTIVPTRDGSAIVTKSTRFDPDFWKEFVPLTKDLQAANEKSVNDIMETPGISDAEKRERIHKRMLADNASLRALILRPALNALQRSVESRAESESVPRRENYTRLDAGISSNAGGGAFLPARIRESHRPEGLLKATYQPFSEQAQKVIKELYGPENRPFAIDDPLLESLAARDEAKKRVDARAAKRRAINAGVLASHADARGRQEAAEHEKAMSEMRLALRPRDATFESSPILRQLIFKALWDSKPRIDELRGAVRVGGDFRKEILDNVLTQTILNTQDASSKFHGSLEDRRDAERVLQEVQVARAAAMEKERVREQIRARRQEEEREMEEGQRPRVDVPETVVRPSYFHSNYEPERDDEEIAAERRRDIRERDLMDVRPGDDISQRWRSHQDADADDDRRRAEKAAEARERANAEAKAAMERANRPPTIYVPVGYNDMLDDIERKALDKKRAAELMTETSKRDLAARSVDLDRLLWKSSARDVKSLYEETGSLDKADVRYRKTMEKTFPDDGDLADPAFYEAVFTLPAHPDRWLNGSKPTLGHGKI